MRSINHAKGKASAKAVTTVTAENKPTPMYILARLNYQCQGLSVANEFKGTGAKADAAPQKGKPAEEPAETTEAQG